MAALRRYPTGIGAILLLTIAVLLLVEVRDVVQALGHADLLRHEPFGALSSRWEVEAALSRLRPDERAEYLALASLARAGIATRDRRLQLASPNEIYARPANLFVAQFVGEMNFVKGAVTGPGKVESPLGVIAATVPNGVTTGTEVTLAIRPEHIEVLPAQRDGVDALVVDVAQVAVVPGEVDASPDHGTVELFATWDQAAVLTRTAALHSVDLGCPGWDTNVGGCDYCWQLGEQDCASDAFCTEASGARLDDEAACLEPLEFLSCRPQFSCGDIGPAYFRAPDGECYLVGGMEGECRIDTFLLSCRVIGRGIEQQGEIGLKLRVNHGFGRFDQAGIDAAATALVGIGCIREAIAHHPLAGRECRKNPVLQMCGACGEHQQQNARLCQCP